MALYDHFGAKNNHMRGKKRLRMGQKMTGEVVVICPTSDRKVPHIQKLVVPILMQVEMNGFSHRSRIAPGKLTIQKIWGKSRCRLSYSLFSEIC